MFKHVAVVTKLRIDSQKNLKFGMVVIWTISIVQKIFIAIAT